MKSIHLLQKLRECTNHAFTDVELFIISEINAKQNRRMSFLEELPDVVESKPMNQVVSITSSIKELKRDLDSLKMKFFTFATPKLLKLIYDQDKIETKYSWNDSIILSKETYLIKLSSYDNYKESDPKASIAKLLGATITI